VAGIAVVLLVLCAAACGAGVTPTVSTMPATSAGPAEVAPSAAVLARVRQSRLTWMISSGALSRLAAAGLPPTLLTAYFDRSSTIVLGGTGASDPLVPDAQPAADFTSASALVAALDHHLVASSVHLLVLDTEAWSLTPLAEQRAPIEAARQALGAATASGRRLIFTPAVDLVPVLVGHRLSGEVLSGAYDRLLAGPGAAVSSELEVQAQFTEGTSSAPTFAARARAAAEQTDPGEPVLVGLSTNPSGRRVTPADLLTLVHDTPGAAGYWLNVPQAGIACPRCGQPQPQVGVAFLEELAGMRPGGHVQPAPSSSRGAVAVGPSETGTGGNAPGTGGPLVDAAGHLLAAGGRPADWILAASQFANVVGRPGVARIMAGGTVFEPVSPHQVPSRLVPVTPTLVVHSEVVGASLLATDQLSADIRAVLYDNERFATTPQAEQSDPGIFDSEVATLASRHGLLSICDLVEPDRLPGGGRVPAAQVPPCAVIGLNTVQQSERDPARYASLVAHDVAVVHAVNPARPVLAGLSANPAGGPVTASELASDIEATHDLVAGYWLNVPSPGIGCPRCAQPDPALMAAALEALGSS